MQIQAYPPLSFHEKGKRGRNEDNIYPPSGQATGNSTVFLVCDGVGGAISGDIASRMVSDAFGSAFENRRANDQSLQETLQNVQQQIDQYLQQNPQSKGMGTTLTFLQLHEDGATIAHAGDSRVYHIRGNTVLFCTDDHSLINDLRKKGLLEEAENAKSNIITRAIQGDSVRKITLDVHYVTDIQADDYFLLCSDGVWGAISNDDLTAILQKDKPNEEKLEEIEELSKQLSKDNYSAYLIQIQNVENATLATIASVKKSIVEDTPTRIVVENRQKARHANWVTPLLVTALLGGIASAAWFWWTDSKKTGKDNASSSSPVLISAKDSANLSSADTTPSVSNAQPIKSEAVTEKKTTPHLEKKDKPTTKNTKTNTPQLKNKPAKTDTKRKKETLKPEIKPENGKDIQNKIDTLKD